MTRDTKSALRARCPQHFNVRHTLEAEALRLNMLKRRQQSHTLQAHQAQPESLEPQV